MDLLKKLEKLRLPTISNGVLDDTVSGNEFDYGAIGSIDVEFLRDISSAKILPFNQGKYKLTAQACTIVNSIRNLLRVANGYYGYTATQQDVFDAVEYATKMIPPYVVGQGWYVWLGVDAARKRWNEKHPDMKMSSYKIDKNDGDFAKLMLKGYCMTGSYNGSTEYGNDYTKDAILDGAKFGKRTYGHCTMWRWDNKVVVDDSYTGNFYNIYQIKQPKQVVENNVWSSNFYFFAPLNTNTDEIKRYQSIINDCTTQNECASNLIKNSVDKTFTKVQENLIISNNKKIQDAKDQLRVL